MSKQVKLDQYFQHIPIKPNLRSNNAKCEDDFKMTLEQFAECTNIKELITADMRNKMPHKFQRKFLLVDKYVKRVYERYISDPPYRKKPLFKGLVFNPKPWHTKRDRELLKQHGIKNCYVNMYEDNILPDIASSCYQKAVEAHGEEKSEAIKMSLPFYLNDIFALSLQKYKTLDRVLRKFKKNYGRSGSQKRLLKTKAINSNSGFQADVRKPQTPVSFNHDDNEIEVPESQDVFADSENHIDNGSEAPDLRQKSNSQNVLTPAKNQHLSLESTLNEVSLHPQEINPESCSTQKSAKKQRNKVDPVLNEISFNSQEINLDRCSTQKSEIAQRVISPRTCAKAQQEIGPDVGSCNTRNLNGGDERTDIFENNGNISQQHSNRLNWMELEHGLDSSKLTIRPLKKQLRETIEINVRQQYPNVIENINAVVDKTLDTLYERITRSVEERCDILGLLAMQLEPRGVEELRAEMNRSAVSHVEGCKIDMNTSGNNIENPPADNLEDSLDNINDNLPQPKMLSYHEFKEYTNIKEYLLSDIVKKYPYKNANYLAKLDKYTRKFYKSYIMGADTWPKGVFFKSKQFLNEIYKKHKPLEVKCEPRDDTENIDTNARKSKINMTASPGIPTETVSTNNPTNCLNGERKHNNLIRENADREAANVIPGCESLNLNNTENALNLSRLHNFANINIISYDSDTNRRRNFQNTMDLNTESGSSMPMVFIPGHSESNSTNVNVGTTLREVSGTTSINSLSNILNSVDSNDIENILNQQASVCGVTKIEEEIKKEVNTDDEREVRRENPIKENQIRESSHLPEDENDVAFIPNKKPSTIYISDEPLSCSLLLEEMMLSPRRESIGAYELPTGFSTSSAENRQNLSPEETFQNNMNCTHDDQNTKKQPTNEQNNTKEHTTHEQNYKKEQATHEQNYSPRRESIGTYELPAEFSTCSAKNRQNLTPEESFQNNNMNCTHDQNTKKLPTHEQNNTKEHTTHEQNYKKVQDTLEENYTKEQTTQNISESPVHTLDSLENEMRHLHGLDSRDSCSNHSNEINEITFEEEQKISVNIQAEKYPCDQSSEEILHNSQVLQTAERSNEIDHIVNINNGSEIGKCDRSSEAAGKKLYIQKLQAVRNLFQTNLGNQEETILPKSKIVSSEAEFKTVNVPKVINAQSRKKEKNVKTKKQLKKKEKKGKLKHSATKTPPPLLNSDLVAQKAHNFRPLVLIKKCKALQPQIVQASTQTTNCQQQQNTNLFDAKYSIEDSSLVSSGSSEKCDLSNKSATIDLLSKDNSFFTSSQLYSKVSELYENSIITPMVVEHSEENGEAAVEAPEIITSPNHWEAEFLKRINLRMKTPSTLQFERITNLSLHQITLSSKINHLKYSSSTPFLQPSTWESLQATITVLTSGCNQLTISGPSLHFLFGMTKGEWICFRQILRYLGVFTYNKNHVESDMEPLSYRVLHNFFKTIPNFAQVIFEYEDANINHVTCLQFNIKMQPPVANLEHTIDSYILNCIARLKNKLNSQSNN